MDISLYFDPVSEEVFEFSPPTNHECISEVIKAQQNQREGTNLGPDDEKRL